MLKLPTLLRCVVALGVLPLLAGCSILSYAATVVGPPPVAAAYKGLNKQKVGIMVWADSGITIDHPSIQPDVARGLLTKLRQAGAAGADELEHVDWVSADSILRFQDDHPELQFEPAEQIAPKLNLTRLIYIEIAAFSLHPNESVDLTRGVMVGSVKVVEINDKKCTVAYREEHISAVYPPKAPPEGELGLEDRQTYQQTIDAFTTELAKRFFTHDADDETR